MRVVVICILSGNAGIKVVIIFQLVLVDLFMLCCVLECTLKVFEKWVSRDLLTIFYLFDTRL